jgi:hypothetical protein
VTQSPVVPLNAVAKKRLLQRELTSKTMALPIDLWLIHPEREMCDAFRERFDG